MFYRSKKLFNFFLVKKFMTLVGFNLVEKFNKLYLIYVLEISVTLQIHYLRYANILFALVL